MLFSCVALNLLIFTWEAVAFGYRINEYQEHRIIIYVNSILRLDAYFSCVLVAFPCTFIVLIIKMIQDWTHNLWEQEVPIPPRQVNYEPQSWQDASLLIRRDNAPVRRHIVFHRLLSSWTHNWDRVTSSGDNTLCDAESHLSQLTQDHYSFEMCEWIAILCHQYHLSFLVGEEN